MKRIHKLALVGFLIGMFAYMLAAQEPKKDVVKPVEVKGPALSVDLLKKFWKAQSEAQQADTAAEKANQAATDKRKVLQDVVQEITKACGDTHQPGMIEGDVGCVEKPKK